MVVIVGYKRDLDRLGTIMDLLELAEDCKSQASLRLDGKSIFFHSSWLGPHSPANPVVRLAPI